MTMSRRLGRSDRPIEASTFSRVLEVVVGGADERHVDRARGQVRRLLGAPDGLHDLLQASFAACSADVLEE